jgi:alpha-mannosidase
VDGTRLVFDLKRFQPRTFAATLQAPATGLPAAASTPVALPFDTDVVTVHGSLEDGAFDPALGRSYAGEQWPATVASGGATFLLGGAERLKLNAVTCRGQAIPIAPKPGQRIHLLAAGLGDRTATFEVGESRTDLAIQDWTGAIRRWDSRLTDGVLSVDGSVLAPQVAKLAPVAAFQTHRHSTGGDEAYEHTYLFRYALDVPDGATRVVLPDDPKVRVFAMSLVDDPSDRVLPVTELYDGFDPRLLPAPAALLGAAVPLPPAEEMPDEASPEVAEQEAEEAEEPAADTVPDAADGDVGPETPACSGPEPCPACPASGGGCAASAAGGGPGALSGLLLTAVAMVVARRGRRDPWR